MKNVLKIVVIFILSGIIFLLICPPFDDEYCKLYPHIVTKFNSSKFDEKSFAKIKNTASYNSVTISIGKPFQIINRVSSDEILYSQILNKIDIPIDDIVFIGYYSERSHILSNTYKWHLFMIFFDKNYNVVGKNDNWFEC